MRDERLEDALKYIDELLELLRNHVSTNDTPEGRTKFELRWFKQEIEEGRLTTLPAPREQSSTLRDVYCEGYLNKIDVRGKRLKRLISILDEGHYLMKPQFYPLVIEEIDKMRALLSGAKAAGHDIPSDLVNALRSIPYDKVSSDQKRSLHPYVMRDLNELRDRFADQTIEPPPVNWDDFLGMETANRKSIFDDDSPEEKQWERLQCLIFEGLRPDPEGKIRNRRW